MLTGDNGILTQASEAKDENIKGQEKEQIRLAMQSKKMEKMADNIERTVTAGIANPCRSKYSNVNRR